MLSYLLENPSRIKWKLCGLYRRIYDWCSKI